MKTLRHDHSKSVMGLFGVCLAVLGGLLYYVFCETISHSLLQKLITLRPDNYVFNIWRVPPVRVELDVYFFNWTNPEEFDDPNTKPRLQEVGPYRFFEKSEKFDIRWHPENASVTYRKRSFYYFDAEGSRGKLSDPIVTLNAVFVSAAMAVSRMDFFRRKVATAALNIYGGGLSVKIPVDELLFKGRNDLLVNLANAFPIFTKLDLPFDKFGYAYPRNGSAEFWGKLNIHTGADDLSKLGKIHTWNDKSHSGNFKSICGMVNGSAGEFQEPYLEVNDTVAYFIPDLCRILPLEYAEQLDIEGVTGYKFIGGLRAMDNGTLYPENKCFCVGECLPSGVSSLAPCWFDTPMYLSYPHFYKADPSYIEAVDGLKPQKDDHELYVVLEPRTGFAMEVAAKLQVNTLVEPLPGFRLFRNIPRLFFPVLWFQERVRMPPEMLLSLRWLSIIFYVGKVIGIICFLIGMVLAMRDLRAKLSKRAQITVFDTESESSYVKNSIEHVDTEMLQLLESPELDVKGIVKTRVILRKSILDADADLSYTASVEKTIH